MAATRTLVNVTITAINSKSLTYVACPYCYGKLQENFYCDKCRRRTRENDATYRYCLVIVVNDMTMSVAVTVFGSSLGSFLGGSPKQVHMLIKRCPNQDFWFDVLKSSIIGKKVILGIKTKKSSMNPNTSLAFLMKNLVNKCENLVATQIFSVTTDKLKFYRSLECRLSMPMILSSPSLSQVRSMPLRSCERTKTRSHYLLPSSGHYEALVSTEKSKRSSLLSSLDSLASGRSRGYGVEDLDSDESQMSSRLSDFALPGNTNYGMWNMNLKNDAASLGSSIMNSEENLSFSTDPKIGMDYSQGGCDSKRNTSDSNQSFCLRNLMNGVNFDDSVARETVGPIQWAHPLLSVGPPRTVESSMAGVDRTALSAGFDRNETHLDKVVRDSSCCQRARGYARTKPLTDIQPVNLDETFDKSDKSDVCLLVNLKGENSCVKNTDSLASGSYDFGESESVKIVQENGAFSQGFVQNTVNLTPSTAAQGSEGSKITMVDFSEDNHLGVSFSPWEYAETFVANFEDSYCENDVLRNVPDSENLSEFLDRCEGKSAEVNNEISMVCKKIGISMESDDSKMDCSSIEISIVPFDNSCDSESEDELCSQNSVDSEFSVDGSEDLFEPSKDMFDSSHVDTDNGIREDFEERSGTIPTPSEQLTPLASQSLFSQSQHFVSPKLNTSTPVSGQRSVRRSAGLLKSAVRNHCRRNFNASLSCNSGNFSSDLFE